MSSNEGAKTVAIPRSLLYYRYFPQWETFFGELGARVGVSGPSTRDTLASGSANAHADSCVPIKLAFGHVNELMGGDADYIFLPRFHRLGRKSYVCPKVIGFTDMIKCFLPSSGGAGGRGPAIIESVFDAHKASDRATFHRIGYGFSWNPFRVERAYNASVARMDDVARRRREEFERTQLPAYRRKIGLLGHPYNVSDDFVNMGVPSELRRRDALAVTSADLPLDGFECDMSGFPSDLFWAFGREIYKTTAYLLKQRDFKLDGMIYIAPFGCGLDSIMMSIVQSECHAAGIPLLPLVVDEHTARAGIITRLEAFLDMI